MDDKLVGYLLQAENAQTLREVEACLQESPELQQRLEHFRRILEPLAADTEPPEPPPGLWVRTLARVAEHQCHNLPSAPLAFAPPAARGRWPRPDVLVAAAVLLVVTGLGLGTLTRARHQYQITACQNNLRNFYGGLTIYSDQHGGSLPSVEAEPPRDVVGMVIPVLYDARVLGPEISLSCPANGQQIVSPPSEQELSELRARAPEEFRRVVSELVGCYAYTLGYWEPGADGRLQLRGLGLRRRAAPAPSPVMADRPPFVDVRAWQPGNSPNHGGKGQNVLFTDGSVKFVTVRAVRPDDDLFLNRQHRLAPGLGPDDAVLAPGWASATATPWDGE